MKCCQWLAVVFVCGTCPTASAQPAKERLDAYGDPLPQGAVLRLGTGRLCAGGNVQALALSPNGKQLVSRTIHATQVWDAATGKLLHVFDKTWSGGDVAAFSSDSTLLATNETILPAVSVWDVANGGRRFDYPMGGDVATCIQFAPKGTQFVVGTSKGNLFLWDAGGEPPWPLIGKVPSRVTCLAWLPDAKTLAIADAAGTVWLWDVAGKKDRGKWVNKSAVFGLACTADGKSLAVITSETIVLVDVATLKTVRMLPHQVENVCSFWLSPEGNHLLLAGRGQPTQVQSFDLAKDAQAAPLNLPSPATSRLAFSRDGKVLALAHASSRMELLHWPSGKAKLGFAGHGQRVDHIAFLAGSKIATISADGDWHLWNGKTGKHVGSVPWPAGLDISAAHRCLTSDGRVFGVEAGGTLAVATMDGKLKRLPSPPQLMDLRDVTPDGKLALLRTFDELLLWDIAAGKSIQRFGGLRLDAKAFLSPDARWVATEENGVVRIFGGATGKVELKPGSKQTALAFSPDNNRIFLWRRTANVYTENLNFIAAIDIATGKPAAFLGARDYGRKVSAFAFSPDGAWMAGVGQYDYGGHWGMIWEASTRVPIMVFFGEASPHVSHHERNPVPKAFGAVAVSSDGQQVAVAVSDSSVLLLDSQCLAAEVLKVKNPTAADFDNAWNALAGDDGPAVFMAMARLVGTPKDTMAFLKGKLAPAPTIPQERLKQLLADLEAKEFSKRQAAATELAKVIEAATPALHKLLEGSPTLELRKRVERLLAPFEKRYTEFPSNHLRIERAIQILERIGSPDARQLLAVLAKGDPRARQTQLAAAALKRLEQRSL